MDWHDDVLHAAVRSVQMLPSLSLREETMQEFKVNSPTETSPRPTARAQAEGRDVAVELETAQGSIRVVLPLDVLNDLLPKLANAQLRATVNREQAKKTT